MQTRVVVREAVAGVSVHRARPAAAGVVVFVVELAAVSQLSHFSGPAVSLNDIVAGSTSSSRRLSHEYYQLLVVAEQATLTVKRKGETLSPDFAMPWVAWRVSPGADPLGIRRLGATAVVWTLGVTFAAQKQR